MSDEIEYTVLRIRIPVGRDLLLMDGIAYTDEGTYRVEGRLTRISKDGKPVELVMPDWFSISGLEEAEDD